MSQLFQRKPISELMPDSVHTLKRVGGPRLEQPSPKVAPTIALLKRMRGEDDDDETLA